VKIEKETADGCDSAKPSAAPIRGAVQGVATTAASAPVKKLPHWPLSRVSLSPFPVRLRPTSNWPRSESAIRKSNNVMTTTKAGDWSWNPHPAWCPPALRISRSAASDQKETRIPEV
jgi:hypothetical protein